jgi:PAS domain S-box-containing protein
VERLEDLLTYAHPEDTNQVRTFLQMLRDGQNGRLEYRVLEGDGSVKWIKIDAHVQCSQDGRSEYLYAACQDISDLRQAEERLEQREFEFSRIVNTMRQGIWVSDADSVCIYVNDALVTMLGHPREDLVGRGSLEDFLGPEPGSSAEEEPFEARLNGPDGTQSTVLVTPRVVRGDDGVRGSFYLITDISRQREELRAQSQARLKLEQVFHTSPGAAFLVDPSTNTVVDINNAFAHTTGLSRESIAGCGAFGLIDSGDLEQLNRMVALLMRRVDQEAVRLLTRSGEPKVFAVSVREVVVDDEELLVATLS